MWEDPIVKEVRDIRREIESECGDDFDRIYAQAIKVQKRYKDRIVSKPQRSREEREPVGADRV